jgi:hypothetical protein
MWSENEIACHAKACRYLEKRPGRNWDLAGCDDQIVSRWIEGSSPAARNGRRYMKRA